VIADRPYQAAAFGDQGEGLVDLRMDVNWIHM
jgi:hypothetical protein